MSSSNIKLKIKRKQPTCGGAKPDSVQLCERLKSPVVREMKNKVTARFKPISLAKIRKNNNIHSDMDAGRNDAVIIPDGNGKCYNTFLENNLITFIKIKQLHLLTQNSHFWKALL